MKSIRCAASVLASPHLARIEETTREDMKAGIVPDLDRRARVGHRSHRAEAPGASPRRTHPGPARHGGYRSGSASDWVDPKDGLIAIYMVQAADSDRSVLHIQFRRLVEAAILK
jgi:hypothetical protein